MKVEKFLLNEKTKVSLNIINFIVLVGFVITASFTFATWKTQSELIDVALDTKITNEIEQRKIADEIIIQEQKELRVYVTEIQAGQIELKEGQARIETDLKWLINALKDN